MTDVLIIAGLVLVATPLLLITWVLFTVAVGLLLTCAGLVRSFGEDVDRRARRAER